VIVFKYNGLQHYKKHLIWGSMHNPSKSSVA